MRLIDADALEREGWVMHRTYKSDAYTMTYEVKHPSDFPTIEAEPIRHAHWIFKENPIDHFECSNCTGFFVNDYPIYVDEYSIDEMKYCNICGARMDGEIECLSECQ